MRRIYIYGAHSRAATLGHYLTYLNNDIEIVSYLYDNDEVNPTQIDGVPVMNIREGVQLDKDCTTYLGIRGTNQLQAIETLKKCGINQIVPVDVKYDTNIRNIFLKKLYKEKNREYVKINDLSSKKKDKIASIVFVAKSQFDKGVKCENGIEYYEKIIQVGSELSNICIDGADYFDNCGDNISTLNRQFCELTAMYWIWKNSNDRIVGLEHYRRKFILPDNWENIFVSNNVDVVLPVPLYVHPSLEENYYFRHVSDGWDTMLEVVKGKYPEEYDDMRQYFKNNGIYSPCNMIIAKKQVFDEMCEWLFPILFECQKIIGELEDKYQNRYPGFLSERLISYYFDKNKEKYKLVYADKCFLE